MLLVFLGRKTGATSVSGDEKLVLLAFLERKTGATGVSGEETPVAPSKTLP